MRKTMAKTGKAGSAAKKSARSSCLTAKAAKAKNVPASTGAPALPFAHRTPSQLHASTYILKRG